MRYREITKEGVFIPKIPEMPVVQIKGKNLSQELLNDIRATKKVEKIIHSSKRKVEKDLRY